MILKILRIFLPRFVKDWALIVMMKALEIVSVLFVVLIKREMELVREGAEKDSVTTLLNRKLM